MKKPSNDHIVETALATVWLDEQGIVCILTKMKVSLTREHLSELFNAVRSFGNGKKVRILNQASNVSSAVSRDDVDFVMEEAKDLIDALAIIATSPLSRMVVNLLLRIRSFPFPMKLFSNERDARQWLIELSNEVHK